ncbi:MAG: hypothetical protein AMS25_18360 [Gemmatimonas sp. SM23_52]|nr:MAG: hypothetical protein AMS25_18360 [Gemmatimonas sp. SM23_52]
MGALLRVPLVPALSASHRRTQVARFLLARALHPTPREARGRGLHNAPRLRAGTFPPAARWCGERGRCHPGQACRARRRRRGRSR